MLKEHQLYEEPTDKIILATIGEKVSILPYLPNRQLFA